MAHDRPGGDRAAVEGGRLEARRAGPPGVRCERGARGRPGRAGGGPERVCPEQGIPASALRATRLLRSSAEMGPMRRPALTSHHTSPVKRRLRPASTGQRPGGMASTIGPTEAVSCLYRANCLPNAKLETDRGENRPSLSLQQLGLRQPLAQWRTEPGSGLESVTTGSSESSFQHSVAVPGWG